MTSPEMEVRPSNECDCGHLIGSHSFDGRNLGLSCDKCECGEYDHTWGMRPKEPIITVKKTRVLPKLVNSATKELVNLATKAEKVSGNVVKITKGEPRTCGCGAVKPAYSGKFCPKCYYIHRKAKKSK